MKKLHYNYLRPPFYFVRLFFFFLLLSVLLSFQLIVFTMFRYEDFVLIVVSLLFLLLTMGAFVEFFKRGEYMSPLEMYDVMGFIHHFLEYKHTPNLADSFFLSYVKKPKQNFRKRFSKRRFFTISTISKHGSYYDVTLLDEAKVIQYLFVRFFSKNATLHLKIRKVKGEFKIVSLE